MGCTHHIDGSPVLPLHWLSRTAITSYTAESAKRNAWIALFAFIDVPIVHFSVTWWRTLHQQATVFNPDLNPHIEGSMAASLWLGVLAFTLLYVVMLDRQYRRDVYHAIRQYDTLDDAIQQRIHESAEPQTGVSV